jgi:nitrate reductase delta subunit
MKSFKALAVLLEYPTPEAVSALPEIEAVLRHERLLSDADLRAIEPLWEFMRKSDVMDLQEGYVDTFDRGRATSLNLFEHVHGESRDRGQAMVDLKLVYEQHGFALSANQLPDYLPAILEYLSLASIDEAHQLLDDCAHILQSIGAALARRNSPYAAVLQGLLRFTGAANVEALIQRTQTEDDATHEAIDRAWAEEPVTFLGACPPTQPASGVVRIYEKGTKP